MSSISVKLDKDSISLLCSSFPLPLFAGWPQLCVGKLLWLFQSYIKHLSDVLFKSQIKFP